MKTRAAVLTEIGLPRPYAQSRPLQIVEVELDPPGPGEVLVRMRAAGLCHSDLSVINGDRPRPMPMAIGHEGAGEVVEVGAGVTNLKVGDHVVAAFVPCCGSCEPCTSGRPALCEPGFKANSAGTLLRGTRRIHRGAEVVNHHLGVSAFADYAIVARESLVKVDSTLPFAEAAVFGCAVMTGVGAVTNTVQVRPEDSVAVVGLGGVGLAALLGARMAGANLIVACDLSDEKLQLARSMGATHTVKASDPTAVEEIRDATRGGVHYAFEMAGSVKAMELAYKITRRGGTTVTAGLSNPQHLFSIPHVGIVAEERTIKGSYLGSCDPARDIPRYIDMYRAGKLPVDRLLSETIALEEINAAFDRLADGKTVRQVVTL
ncbi:zinc-dependent alcohol dehydrogenase family protein [Steroidobacter sp.]|uniref:zinc-dependent alcohol dehydrogenase family protein n=1 Tax=Steroidobacter sp. TaxID=1978227 RepID=UPI001A5EB921|nr:zinc-dependent alcohol dehydrogenase family protein [Steroidobacter sp.]MBL8265682.1 zinc-dependent alcohol dehydrogenase family protein [Steroidobacter sp.]